MITEEAKLQFLLIMEKDDITPYLPYIEAAAAETERLLRPEYKENYPSIVNSFTAVSAMRLYALTRCARGSIACTEAGTVEGVQDMHSAMERTETVLSFVRSLCSPYLRDEAFVMMGISPGRKEKREVKPDAEGDSSGDEGETAG
ncbi:MAG: hypothetical protein IJ512_09000 [Ruminococcus sp.]|nr:hypothetical protein [Ruminococcus sp.]